MSSLVLNSPLAPPHALPDIVCSATERAAALVADATPKILSELYILTRFLPGTETGRRELEGIDVAPVLHHLDLLSHELKQLIPEALTRQELFGSSLDNLCTALDQIRKKRVAPDNWRIEDVISLSSSVRQILCSINSAGFYRTRLAPAPGIDILEFDSEFSGVLDPLISEVMSIQQHLLVDPSLLVPQNGFGRAEEPHEIRSALSLGESRLFGVCLNQELQGFLVTENNQELLHRNRGEILSLLTQHGYIDESQRVSFVRILGLRFDPRKQSARHGIDLYDQLMQAADFSWRGDGISLGIGLVREGENANTAIYDHMRVGWKKTDIQILSADGKTPYRVIIRPVENSRSETMLPLLGFGSHFAKYCSHPSVTGLTPHDANTIWNSEALQCCKEYFKTFYPSCEVRAMPGYHGFSISLHAVGRNVGLNQARPRTDAWRSLSFSDPDKVMSLKECLPLARNFLLGL
jgi:hypothetical protein